MLNKLDAKRLNFVLPVGRRFYVAASMILRYIHNINQDDDSSSINGVSPYAGNSDYEEDVRISCDIPIQTFHPYSDFEVHGRNTEVFQLFTAFDSMLYLNWYKNVDESDFSNFFDFKYSKKIASVYYAATKYIVPVEANLTGLNVDCIYGPQKIAESGRYPLIDLLYRSNEMVNFINYLTVCLLFSTHLYVDIHYCSMKNSMAGQYGEVMGSFNESWDSKILDFQRFFSHLKKKN